jgi:hypothetical protein
MPLRPGQVANLSIWMQAAILIRHSSNLLTPDPLHSSLSIFIMASPTSTHGSHSFMVHRS